MGCDIHAYVETYQYKMWWFKAEIEIKRNYNLFSALAGVRGWNMDAITAPRGFPDDASRTVDAEFKEWGQDAHTPTWFTLKELHKINWKKRDLERFETEVVKPMECWGKPSEVRLIVWFDN